MPVAEMLRSGNLLRLTPSNTAILSGALTYIKRVTKGGRGGKQDVEYQTIKLFTEDDGALFAPAGLSHRIYEVLKAAGIEVTFKDNRKLSQCLLNPDLSRLEPLRERQDEVLAAVMANDMGIIQVPTGGGKSFLIRQICRIWHECRIVIASYSRDIVKMLHRELMELLPPDELGLVCTGCSQTDRRVTCVVDRSLMKVDLSNVDIFIYDEVHRAAAPCTSEVIYTCRNARMYGFSASPTGRSDNADLETEAMFGRQIAVLSYEDIQKTGAIVPMLVFKVSCADLPAITAQTTISRERHGLWRNEHRNKRIADMVQWLRQYFDPDMQILIAVKSVEHAVYLGSLLPDFALVYATMDADKRERWERMGLIKKGDHPLTANNRDQLREDFESGKLRRAIATNVWSAGVDFPFLTASIRADGQASPIAGTQIPGRATRSSDGKTFGIVVDFDDAFNITLARRAESRFRVYKKKGWAQEVIAPQGPVYAR